MINIEETRTVRSRITDVQTRTQSGVWYASEVHDAKHTLTAYEDLPASEILGDFQHGPTVSDDLTVSRYCQYEQLRGELGNQAFNIIFSGDNRVVIQSRPYPRPLAYFTKSQPLFDPKDFKVGDIGYIRGVPDYEKRHPRGKAMGWSVVCLSHDPRIGPRFGGLGLAETPQDAKYGFTEAEIRLKMVDDFNRLPRLSTILAYSQSAGIVVDDLIRCKLEKLYLIELSGTEPFHSDREALRYRAEKAGIPLTRKDKAVLSRLLAQIPPRVPRHTRLAEGLMSTIDRLDSEKMVQAKRQPTFKTREDLRQFSHQH